MVSQPKRERPSAPIADANWSRVLKQARDVFGDRLTAVILTGERQPVFDFGALTRTTQSNRGALTAALDIARGLLELESKSTVQAWYVGMNPMLEDRAPALVVRSDPDSVRDAAQHFAAYS
jgi:hypothetical protein